MTITRKELLRLMSASAASFMPQENTAKSSGTAAAILYFQLDLNNFAGFRVTKGSVTVEIGPEEVWATLNPKPGSCPSCGNVKSEILGSVALGADGNDGIGDHWFPNIGWRPDLQLRRCTKCGTLFAVERVLTKP